MGSQRWPYEFESVHSEAAIGDDVMGGNELTGGCMRRERGPGGLALGTPMLKLLTEEGEPAKETKEWVVRREGNW